MWFKDSIVIVTITSIAFILAVQVDLYERMDAIFLQHEDWEVDELLIALFFLLIGSIWFSYRRLAESKQLASLVQEKLSETSKLSSVIHQASDSIIITDKHGKIEFVNPAFSQTTAYSESEVLGKSPHFLLTSESVDIFFRALKATTANGDEWRGKVVCKDKAGKTFASFLTVSPVHDQNGKVIHYAGVLQNLQNIVDMENQLFQAQKMESIGTLVGGIAHDFNNILAGIVGSVFLAQRELGKNRRLASIESQASRAAEMVKQLLAFARKDSRKMSAMSLNDLIDESSTLFRLTVSERVRFNVSVCEERLAVNGDFTQLQQAVINLANNARDALEQSEMPAISLLLEKKSLPERVVLKHSSQTSEQYACITVSDNGHGIAAMDLKEIFEPFFTKKEIGKGTGLGLSMVQGCIESHGGIVDVESSVGEGTIFSLYLPLLEADLLHTTAHSDTKMIERLAGGCVLLVDDDAVLREINRGVLEELGYRVIEAFDGRHAVEKFIANKAEIQFILMDVVMPYMDGIEAARQIRQISITAPIVFVTGYDPSQELGKIDTESAPSAVLEKPFKVEDLLKAVETLNTTDDNPSDYYVI